MTVTELNALVDEAVTLMGAGSWAAAKAKLLAAHAGLAVMPDRRAGEHELKFDRRAIAELLKQVELEVKRAASAGRVGGLRSMGIRLVGDQ